jgi:thioesterase domain-containing protein
MKKIQPRGPYCLGGYCDVGEVALEMAQQLNAEGEKVNFLALIEFYPPTVFKPFDLKERVKYYSSELKRLPIKKKALFFSELVSFKFRKLMKRTSRVINTKFRNLRNSEYLIDKDGYLIGKGLYSAKPYNGKVLLFKSSIETLRTHDAPSMGWSDYFKDAEVFTIEGDHKTMFHKPGSIQIAEKLNAYAVLKE